MWPRCSGWWPLRGLWALIVLVLTALGVGALTKSVVPAGPAAIVLPIGHGVTAIALVVHYLRHRGLAACLLAGYLSVLALMCSFFWPVVNSASRELGYWHYSLMMVLATLLGWMHLPRELRHSPIDVPLAAAGLFLVSMILGEVAVTVGLLWPSHPAFAGGTALQLVATMLLYYPQAHRAVLRSEVLESQLSRTTVALERQSEVQKELIASQAEELRRRAAVIERQHHLAIAGKTAASAAHDMVNVIGPILHNVAAIERELEQGQDGDAVAAAARIRGQAEHLLEVNGQLLTMSRQTQSVAQVFDASEVLPSICAQFPEDDIRLNLQAGAWVEGCPHQLSRAVTNLVKNATEAAPGRPLELSCSVDVGSNGAAGFEAGRVLVRVADQGPGVPPEIRGRMFEPFFTTRGAHGGSGLGLSSVAAVARDHDALVEVSSSAAGTTVTLAIPLWRRVDHRLDGRLVVVLDACQQGRCAAALREVGMRVLEVEGPRACYRALERHPEVELVLLRDAELALDLADIVWGAIHLRPDAGLLVLASGLEASVRDRVGQLGASVVASSPGSAELLEAVRHVVTASTQRVSR